MFGKIIATVLLTLLAFVAAAGTAQAQPASAMAVLMPAAPCTTACTNPPPTTGSSNPVAARIDQALAQIQRAHLPKDVANRLTKLLTNIRTAYCRHSTC